MNPFFEYAFEETILNEGGYGNDPFDRGGETKYGVTIITFNRAKKDNIIYSNDIKDLTINEAKIIYKTYYWDAIKLDEIKHKYIASELFDTAINSGTSKAVLLAQMALTYLGEELTIDGKIGPETLTLLNKWCHKNPRSLFFSLNGFQFIHYVLIVDEKKLIDELSKHVKPDKDQKRFSNGWTKRLQNFKG